jgi:hypothetical protein
VGRHESPLAITQTKGTEQKSIWHCDLSNIVETRCHFERRNGVT